MAYGMCSPQSFCLCLGYTNIVKLALLQELGKDFDGLLYGIVWVHSSRLKQIKLLGAAKLGEYVVDTVAKIGRARRTSVSGNVCAHLKSENGSRVVGFETWGEGALYDRRCTLALFGYSTTLGLP